MADMLEPRSPLQNARGIANVLLFSARVGAVTVEVFLHRQFGTRYFGGQAAAALLAVPMFGALLYPQHDQRPLLVFLGLFFVFCRARGESLRLQKRGVIVHSRYNGWPRSLKADATPQQELRAKLIGEPFLVGLWGVLSYVSFNQPLGAYLIFAAVSLMVTNGMYRMHAEQQAQDLHDAIIEQQGMAQRFHEVQRRR